MKSAVLMSACLFAIGFAAHAADSSVSSPPAGKPDRAAMHAAMETCASSAGVTKGNRPSEEQHASIDACMKAAGFEKPPGPPRGGGHHGGRPPGPPPEDDSSSSSAQ